MPPKNPSTAGTLPFLKQALVNYRPTISCKAENLRPLSEIALFKPSKEEIKDVSGETIDLDRSQISLVEDLVDTRNDMAHASGKFEILTEESYDAKVSSILSSMGVICGCMDRPIRKWYGQVLLSFCKGEYEGYDDPKDFIVEQMIQTFRLSTNELLICNEMSVSSLITEHRGYEVKLKAFKKALKEYCQEMGFV